MQSKPIPPVLRNYTLHKLEIILQKHMAQEDLDLVRGEESARTGMHTESEAQVLG